MTGYDRRWTCTICEEEQRTMDYAKPAICDKCLERLADTLCKEHLNIPLTTPGVDRGYWMEKARQYAAVLHRRTPSIVRN